MRPLAWALLLVLAACDEDVALAPDAPPAGPPTCNPVIGDDCLTPFPSSYFEVAAATPTGVQVALPEAILPKSRTGMGLRPDRLNAKDGFSPSTPFIVYFAAGVDATQLPTADDLAISVTPTSPVQIIDYTTGARVPLFAELDANVLQDADRQGLLIHPMERLQPNRRYIVALVGVRDKSGKPLAPAPFTALRDRAPLTSALQALAPRYEEIFAKLGSVGLTRGALTLAWDVVTASDAQATSHLVAMRDQALALVDQGQVTYRVDSVKETPNEAHRLRELQLTISGPNFLTSSLPDAMMSFDADGQPAINGTRDVPVTIEVPRCAATATKPLPYVVFGPGLFGTAKATLAMPVFADVSDRFCMILIGTDWIGLSTEDVGILATYVLPDLNKVYIITDRLQQAHVNFQVMQRLFAKAIKDDDALKVDGHAITDGKEVYYFGVSNGGVQGGTFMALSPDVTRGVLNVPGCEWSLMIWRSTQFNPINPLLGNLYPDPLDRQLLVAASQAEWDYADPASFARHLLADPLPGAPMKHILVQESIGDAQVPNLATRILARTMGLKGLDLTQHVYGVDEVGGPLDSAYTQWNSNPSPLPPTTDVPAPSDNGAHNAIQGFLPLQDQIQRFYKPDGRIESTCGGPCTIK
jgi:hypothetical protein